MLSVEERRKLVLLGISSINYVYLKKKSLDGRSATNEIWKAKYEFGEFNHLYEKLRLYPELFKNYTRVSVDSFDLIVIELKKDFEDNRLYAANFCGRTSHFNIKLIIDSLGKMECLGMCFLGHQKRVEDLGNCFKKSG